MNGQLTALQILLMVCGLWAVFGVSFYALGELCLRIAVWRARRRETQAIIDELISECRVASRWIIAEPKGRG